MDKLPKWADVVLVPLISLAFAAILSALVILAIGQDPVEALKVMVTGALGSPYGWGYTLYYTTSFIFTGLAVTIAFHASLFNIGGEGQAQLGGLGVALVCLALPWPHWTLALMAAANGFEGIAGVPNGFEYWSFGKSDESETGFGYCSEPVLEGRKQTGLKREEFLSKTEEFLREAIDKWIKGDHPFTARLNPDLPGYNDYDQLMRLDEWQARGEPGA